MIRTIMIPLAAFALTAATVSAFSGDFLDRLDIDLTEEQVSALEEVRELREKGADRDDIRDVLNEAELDRETMHDIQKAAHEYHLELQAKVHAALETGDYEVFRTAVTGTPLEDTIDSEDKFNQFLEAFDLRQSGNYEEARGIMSDLGVGRPGGFGPRNGMGYGMGEGMGERMGHKEGFRQDGNRGGGIGSQGRGN